MKVQVVLDVQMLQLVTTMRSTIDDGSCEFTSCDCPEDVNGDGVISVADILALLGQFGCTSGCTVDLNDDDATNVQDILILLAAFGTEC